ncbi:nicotinamide mononucleotide transporter [Paucimonas lemoignei]|uniref:Nicotinamide riboside transporter PnuC n=2 Tax=Paucimonas lemoignei TaxID=29443 RepID=A0A4R3HR91_PAULE|nr:nicotinamide mononucleotide transporter [Paucimonas lemoignei]
MSPLEIAANGMATISILLAGRNSVHTWWTGITGCFLFAVLFFQASLYADVVLQIFFVVTSVLGWWHWMKGAQGNALRISRADFKKLAWTIPVGLLATAGYGALLHFFTDAYAPFVDSAVLVFSVVAQLLLMQRRLETWAFWLVVNSIAVPLYASRELYLTSFLYASYWINALVSWRWWQRSVANTASI